MFILYVIQTYRLQFFIEYTFLKFLRFTKFFFLSHFCATFIVCQTTWNLKNLEFDKIDKKKVKTLMKENLK